MPLTRDDIQTDSHADFAPSDAPARSLLCEHCGYDLRGLRANRCPECGRRFEFYRRQHDRSSLSNRALLWLFLGPPAAGIAATIILSGIASAGADNSIIDTLSVLIFVSVATSCVVSSLVMSGELVARHRRKRSGYQNESLLIHVLSAIAFFALAAVVLVLQLLLASMGTVMDAASKVS